MEVHWKCMKESLSTYLIQTAKYFSVFAMGFLFGITQVPQHREPVIPSIRDTITLIDSFYIVNDSIVEKIKYLEQDYEKDTTVILSNSDSANLVYFTEYLEHYNNK